MKKGFTLSEVLITLGIVGIVAVLTIPAVMKDYKYKLYTAQLQKVYSQLSDATKAIMNDENSTSFYETTAGVPTACVDADAGDCKKGAGYFLNNYFKPIKRNCKNGPTNFCLAGVQENSYKSIDGLAAGVFFGEYCIQTSNGAAICMSFNPANGVMSVAVDVNGTSEPNIAGRDVFTMNINADGTVADYDTNPDNCNIKGGDAHIGQYSSGCLARIIDDGWKMKY